MEASPVASPRSGGRSRFSKALPAPPSLEKPDRVAQVALPVRKDSLPSASRPALPPKDTAVRSIPSNMATKVMDAPLPRLPALTRVNSPPSVMPKRKPVGSGASVKSAKSPPRPPPTRSGDISPVESISSLISAYGTEDSSAARYSVDTAATQHSLSEPSPPKLPPKDSLGAYANNKLDKLDIVSPLALPTPVSSRMDTSQAQPPQAGWQDDRPPTPPRKDRQMPTTPPEPKGSQVLNDSPTSLSNQSPEQPQLWRRRSLKAVKPLAVPELKLTKSHGSTASAQQVANTMNNGHGSLPSLKNSVDEAGGDSPILNGFDKSSSGRNIEPSQPQALMPRNPQPSMGNKKSKESLDGFSQYAQEVEDSMSARDAYHHSRDDSNGNSNSKTNQYSPAKLSPEIRRPPTPEYATDETRADDPVIYSPISPMTPPDDPRPLSVIQEHPEVSAVAPPAGPLPGLPPRSSSRPGASGAQPPADSPAGRTAMLRANFETRRSPLGTSSPMTGAASASSSSSPAHDPALAAPSPAGLAPSPAIQPSSTTPPHPHMRSTSATSVPSIEVTSDGETSTIKASSSPRPTHTYTNSTTRHRYNGSMSSQRPASSDGDGDAAASTGTSPPSSPPTMVIPKPGDPAYFPLRHSQHHQAQQSQLAQARRGVPLPAAPLRRTQLDCFGAHYRFVPSRNEDHPLACQACHVSDAGARFTCAHCSVRLCGDCRDVLLMNGRDLGSLVEMLKS